MQSVLPLETIINREFCYVVFAGMVEHWFYPSFFSRSRENLVLTSIFACFRAGKTSIQKVVFHKMSPNETLFLEMTNKIVKNGAHSAAPFPPAFAVAKIPPNEGNLIPHKSVFCV